MPHILLVDDDADFLELHRATLELVGNYTVEVAQDGLAALERIKTGKLPDLVISDVLMPRMDGFELLTSLRRLSLDVPVVFTSAIGRDSSHRTDGLRLGAMDFIAKPCEPEEILIRIERLLAPTFRVAPPPTSEPLTTLPSELLQEDDVDTDAARARPPESRAAPQGAVVGGDLFPSAHVTGRIERLSLPALFALSEAERKSGVLAVRNDAGTLWLTINAGRPWRASMTDGLSHEGKAAVYCALEWKEGRFEFLDTEVEGDADMQTTFTHLLMEHAQLSDEGRL